MSKNPLPVLIGYVVPGEQIKAWRPYCREWHLHGIGGETVKTKVVGSWAAHCKPGSGSPLKSTVYDIKIMAKKEIRAIADSIELYD